MTSLASLRYLLALNEHRHFGRAAQACHITQPALSNALKALEEEFGVDIPDEAAEKILTVGDAMAYIDANGK